MHGLITGNQSRQQLYTMCTGDAEATTSTCSWSGTATRTPSSGPTRYGPPPRRAARTNPCPRHTPRSASTLLRDQQDPAVRLGDSVERYLDALHAAAEEVIGRSAVHALQD